MTFHPGRSPRPVHIGRGLFVHPTTARWLGLSSKPTKSKRKVKDLFK